MQDEEYDVIKSVNYIKHGVKEKLPQREKKIYQKRSILFGIDTLDKNSSEDSLDV